MPSATTWPTGRRLRFARPLRGVQATGQVLDERMHEALSDMYAYALALEAESRRLASGEVREEAAALRNAISAIRLRVDPSVAPR